MGCSPLITPKGRSRSKKAKKRRSAAFFFTLFHFSPIDPSGAKINSMGVELKAPLCKGSWLRDSADWGIVTLPENRPAPVISQSLRHGSAVPPPFTQGRLCGAP